MTEDGNLDTKKVRVGIVDDEPLARRRLERLVRLHADAVGVGSWSSPGEALQALQTTEVDVLLLDIQLGALSGLDLARTLRERVSATGHSVKVIFVTAHRDHALRAFELGAIDYLLKPVSAERIAEALRRVAPAYRANRDPNGEQRLQIPTRNGVVMIAQASVVAATYDELLELHLADGSSLWVDWTLAHLEEVLGLADFLRVGRRHGLRPTAVESLRMLANGTAEATLAGGTLLPVSRRAVRRLRDQL